MCARYSLTASQGDLEALFAAAWPAVEPDDDVRPTDGVLALGSDGVPRKLQWGLVPRWASDPSVGQRLINARSETAAEKPSFREAFRKRRCILPASAFYEWREEPLVRGDDQPALFDPPAPARGGKTRKRRYRFSTDAPAFAIAGLWETWHAPDGSDLLTCTLLTTAANAAVRPFHDRMPSILRPEDVPIWLDEGIASEEKLLGLLGGPDAGAMRVQPSD